MDGSSKIIITLDFPLGSFACSTHAGPQISGFDPENSEKAHAAKAVKKLNQLVIAILQTMLEMQAHACQGFSWAP